MNDKTEWYQDPDELLGALKQHTTRRERLPTVPGYGNPRELGRGGQGIVYTAEQLSTKRKVAIKVLLAGAWAADSRRRRFEREIDLIASLRHPGIVSLYDSGVTDEGYPYYVMEYIEGLGLDEAIGAAAGMFGGDPLGAAVLDARVPTPRQNRAPLLSLKPSLELVAKIADAIHYAHQRGVIHRDLKPSNIRLDGDLQPHVLDFGLAKLADGSSGTAVQATMSQTGEFMGSLPWASPEQVEGTPDKIDVRTDVYSLGVMLYQMLTGEFPYAVVGTFSEVLGNIRTAMPRRPSLIHKDIDDEVETIVLKCLAKEPDRRYQSVGDLARDLRHYLAGEPIEAKRDSAMYNLRKAMRRYQYTVRVSAAVVVLMLAASIWLTFLWQRAVRAEQLAEQRRVSVENSRQMAEREADRARTINEFLTGMLARPIDLGREARIADVLDDAVAGLGRNTHLDREVEASLRMTIAASYATLGLYEKAEPQMRRALEMRRRIHGDEHPDVIASQRELSQVLCSRGRFDEAEAPLPGGARSGAPAVGR